MRERFDSEYIRSELERISDHLETPLTVYLIGDGSMTFRNLKETTKDIDLVVTDGDALQQFQVVLLDCGYEVVKDPSEEYHELGAQRILENADGCRIDMFNQKVVDKLVLSEGMRERSVTHLEAGELTVALVSTEDVFLFKSVAGRTDDIDDMFTLVQTGLDFDIVEAELEQQIDLLGRELFVSYVNEALMSLDERHNITTPLFDPVSKITQRVYEKSKCFMRSTTRFPARNYTSESPSRPTKWTRPSKASRARMRSPLKNDEIIEKSGIL
jgi:hypothetical protein